MTTSAAEPGRRSRTSRTLLRRTETALVLSLCLIWLLYYSFVVSFMVQRLNMNDFGKFYYSARSFLDGQDMYAWSPAASIPVSNTESPRSRNMNPPHFHLLMLPLAVLSPAMALSLWMIANLFALCVSLRLISRELQFRWTPDRAAWTAAAVTCCSATGAIAVTGQLTFLLLLPVTVAWIAIRHNNWNRAAIWLGVSASVKPFVGIFLIWLLLRRDRTPAAVMVFASGACILVGLVIFGWTAYEAWLGELTSANWPWAAMNGSLAALVSRAFGENPFYAPVIPASWLITPVTAVLALSIGVMFVLQLLYSPPRLVDHTFAALLLTAQLVSPLGWVYYLWLIIGPAAAVFESSKPYASRRRDRLLALAIPGLLVPFSVTTTGSSSPWVGLTLGSIYVWTTVFLWAAVMDDWRMRVSERSSGVFQADSRTRVGTARRPPAPDCSPALPAS